MSFRYSRLKILSKAAYRSIFPIAKSAYTEGEIADICAVELVPPKELKKFFLASIKRLQKIKGDDIGDFLEFGVFNGLSISCMFYALRELKITTRILAFDAFDGLPVGSEQEDGGVWRAGYYRCSFKQTVECLRRSAINSNDIIWIAGWYQETLNNKTKEQLNIKKIGIVFIDCDTYSSSKAALNFIAPQIREEAIICLDDWKLNNLDIKGLGEYKSFNEFLEENPQLKAEEIKSYSRKSKAFLVSPAK